MPSKTTPNTSENVKHFIEQLESPKKKLTAWEVSFLESVSEQFDAWGQVTQKQFDVLEKLYAEKT